MINKKIIFIFLGILVCVSAKAQIEDVPPVFKSAVLVEPNSPVHRHIDMTIEKIFSTKLHDVLCGNYPSAMAIQHSLGVSPITAESISATCPESMDQNPYTKIFERKYFLVPSGYHQLDSWTDYGNRTYIFNDVDLTLEKLELILIHELAISLDAKIAMMPTTYLRYQIPANDKRKTIFLDVDDVDEDIQKAFRITNWGPIRDSFAALRAFQVEKIATQNANSSMDHKTCVTNFMEIYNFMISLPPPPQPEGAQGMPALITGLVSKNTTPKSLKENQEMLDHILNKKLKLKNENQEKVSFCQYMSTPLLTKMSMNNFFGSGPRPRVTGGTGGQGE